MVVSNDSGSRLPTYGVDERLIMPETRYEAVDGEVVYVTPAETPHASRHSKLSALLEAHVADGFDAACDMLTRTSAKSDFAPDGSIYPEAPDPETGGRQLEHLSFEVVSTETLSHAAKKAAELRRRGVRRVFAIDVERQRALEWNVETESWQVLHPDDAIEDAALAAPLPIAALVGAAETDDAVAAALLAKGNAVLRGAVDEGEARGRAEGEARGRAEGEARGARRALLQLIEARFGPADAATRARVDDADEATILGWIRRCATADAVTGVFDAD